MTAFEQIRESTRRFGNNSYLEVARKRLVEPSGASAEFILVTRGFYDGNGEKRWTKFVTVPDEKDLREWLAEALRGI